MKTVHKKDLEEILFLFTGDTPIDALAPSKALSRALVNFFYYKQFKPFC